MQEDKSFKDQIDGLLKSYKLNGKYEEVKVVQSWEKIAGKQIAQKTSRLFIKDEVLFLYLTSAPMKSELKYYKEVIIEKVNTFVGKKLIKDITIF